MANRKQKPLIQLAAPLKGVENPSQVHDSDGVLWNVCETRHTVRGFPFFLGYPAGSPQRSIGIIVTQALLEYWEAHVADFYANLNLPASRASIAKIRERLGSNVINARRFLWSKPAADLKRIQVCQFAEEHEIPVSTAIRWRATLLGNLRKARIARDPESRRFLHADLHNRPVTEMPTLSGSTPPNNHEADVRPLPPKWNKPAIISLLGSNLTCAQTARALRISWSHAQRLRRSLRYHRATGLPLQ